MKAIALLMLSVLAAACTTTESREERLRRLFDATLLPWRACLDNTMIDFVRSGQFASTSLAVESAFVACQTEEDTAVRRFLQSGIPLHMALTFRAEFRTKYKADWAAKQ